MKKEIKNNNVPKGMTTAMSLALAGAGLVLGGVGGYVSGMAAAPKQETASQAAQSQQATATDATPRIDTKAADLRVLINSLQKQHVDLASSAVRNGFDGDPDFGASAAELDKNSVALSKAVGSVYGAEAEKQFLEIWRSHIGFFVDYTVAAKAGDKVKMEQAVANLNGYVDAIANFFSKANPNLPKEAVAQLVTEHVMHLKGAVDTYGAGNYEASYVKQTDAYNQIGNIADAISGAIVKQNPDTFK